jgi:mannose-6-phosphate isomerase-like protein (cupin superfamily)
MPWDPHARARAREPAGAGARPGYQRCLLALRLALGLGLALALALASGLAATAGAEPESATPASHGATVVLRLRDLAERHPAPPPAAAQEVARGSDASVNFWQLREEIPLHVHRTHEELIVVLEGSVVTTVGTDAVTLGPGDAVLVPRDTAHGGRAAGVIPARGYSVFAPPFDGADRLPVTSPGPTPEPLP